MTDGQRASSVPPTVWAYLGPLAIAALDMMVVASALPSAVGTVGGIDAYSWPMTIYMFMLVLWVPFFGYLAARLGHAPALVLGLLVAAAGTWLATDAPTFATLVMARAIQGAGASAVWALPLAVLMAARSGAARAAARTWNGIGVLAPVLAVALLTVLSWQGVFRVYLWTLLALAVVLLAVVLLARREAVPLAELLARDLTGLPQGWQTLVALPVVLLGVGARMGQPPASADATVGMLPAWPGRVPAFLTAAFMGQAVLAMIVFLPLSLAAVWQGVDWRMGLVMLLLMAGQVAGAAGARRWAARVGGKGLVSVGLVMAFVSALLFVLGLQVDVGLARVAILAVIFGLGAGLAQQGLLVTATERLPAAAQLPAVAAIEGTRMLLGTLGTGLVGTIMAVTFGLVGPSDASVYPVLDAAKRATMPTDQVNVFADLLVTGVSTVHWAVVVLLALTGLCAALLPGGRDAAV